MIYFEVTNEMGKIVASNISDSIRLKYGNNKNFVDHVNGIGFKGIFEYVNSVGIWMIVENEKDLLKNSKEFHRRYDFYKEVALGVYCQQREQLSATKHILPNIHTQMVQEVDLFTGNNLGIFHGENFNETKQNIAKFAQEKPEDTARLIASLNKLIIDMGAHLRGVDVVHFGEEYTPEMKEVRIKSAILHQYSSFAKEFDEAYLYLKVNAIDDEATVIVDKNMFSLVMYNLLSNSVKYCRPESEVRFHYLNENKQLDISMMSLRIDPDEIQKVFDEGIRGRHAITSPGSGLGLFVIKKALEIMNKQPMRIEPNYQKTYFLNNETYVENHFLIDFH